MKRSQLFKKNSLVVVKFADIAKVIFCYDFQFKVKLKPPEHLSLKVPNIKFDFDVAVDCVQW